MVLPAIGAGRQGGHAPCAGLARFLLGTYRRGGDQGRAEESDDQNRRRSTFEVAAQADPPVINVSFVEAGTSPLQVGSSREITHLRHPLAVCVALLAFMGALEALPGEE